VALGVLLVVSAAIALTRGMTASGLAGIGLGVPGLVRGICGLATQRTREAARAKVTEARRSRGLLACARPPCGARAPCTSAGLGRALRPRWGAVRLESLAGGAAARASGLRSTHVSRPSWTAMVHGSTGA
jgi:hypothetical protein